MSPGFGERVGYPQDDRVYRCHGCGRWMYRAPGVGVRPDCVPACRARAERGDGDD